MPTPPLPDLPYAAWTNSRITLHLIFQIIGKAKLKLTPRKNHWWYITFHLTASGFSTLNIPIDEGHHSLEISINVKRQAVVISPSNGEEIVIPLQDGLTVAAFYQRFMSELQQLGLQPRFIEKPLDLDIEQPFREIEQYYNYDWTYIDRFWQIMRWNDAIFQEFSGRFYGKSCPVHIYWHHLDLTVTRFSGKKLPPVDKSARILERDTYTHEQISFGFWVGDEQMQEPMYYSYTYPSPDGLDQKPLRPSQAKWVDSNGSPMALVSYADIKANDNPRATVLAFLESAYLAGAQLAGWEVDELRVPPLEEM
ncbi:MAG: DUF5996 family protein [Bacteroidota bacterium]